MENEVKECMEEVNQAGGEYTEEEAKQTNEEEEREVGPELTLEEMRALLGDLKSQLEAKSAECENLFSRLQRLQADFDNFRKRMRREQIEVRQFATERLIKALLPVLDNLEMALRAASAEGEKEGLLAGVQMICRQLVDILRQEGLKPMEVLGLPFDPALHEAVECVPASAPEENNRVVEELRKGYFLRDKLLRPALVKVALAGGPEPAGQEIDQDQPQDD
ncbi:MAG: molecular chaperone GrpE [Clostridia bacterium]|nr:molecular chaperone GrpE [Clostridia bacterium]